MGADAMSFRRLAKSQYMLVSEVRGVLTTGTQDEVLAAGKAHDRNEILYVVLALTTNDQRPTTKRSNCPERK
jgi:hypothetical protein